MKIEECRQYEFHPIIITIETPDELDELCCVLTLANSAVMNEGPPFLQQTMAKELRKIKDRFKGK